MIHWSLWVSWHPVDVKFFTGVCAASKRGVERNLGWERNRYNREERGERGEGDARHWRQQTEMEEKREGGGVWMNNLVPPFPLSSSLLSWGCCKHRGEERKKRDGERRKGKEERGGNKGRRGDKMRWKKKEEKRKGDEGRGSERRRGCCHLFSPQNKLCK